MRNIKISDKADQNMAQGESWLKYLLLAFLAAAWLCRDISHHTAPISIERIYHTERGQDTSLFNLIADWF